MTAKKVYRVTRIMKFEVDIVWPELEAKPTREQCQEIIRHADQTLDWDGDKYPWDYDIEVLRDATEQDLAEAEPPPVCSYCNKPYLGLKEVEVEDSYDIHLVCHQCLQAGLRDGGIRHNT